MCDVKGQAISPGNSDLHHSPMSENSGRGKNLALIQHRLRDRKEHRTLRLQPCDELGSMTIRAPFKVFKPK